MEREKITGIVEYCYNGIPIVRGYCPYKTLIKHSKAHFAYQRQPQDTHVAEIKEYISGGSYKFMPEVILSYDYKGLYGSIAFNRLLSENPYLNPIQHLMDATKSTSLNDVEQFISIKRSSCQTPNLKIVQFEFEEPHLDEVVFNRIDGNHRLEALEMLENEDFKIPFCIVLLNGHENPALQEREKTEMELFHNINAKAKPLTPIEQYRGLFELFTIPDLEVFGKEFSLTKEYLQKYRELHFTNLSIFTENGEDIILYAIKFLLAHQIDVTTDKLMATLNKLEHTYFQTHEQLRSCKSRLAIIPYIYYCFSDRNGSGAKLAAYNTWFIKNKLYDVKDIDPTSMIDIFDKIYDLTNV